MVKLSAFAHIMKVFSTSEVQTPIYSTRFFTQFSERLGWLLELRQIFIILYYVKELQKVYHMTFHFGVY